MTNPVQKALSELITTEGMAIVWVNMGSEGVCYESDIAPCEMPDTLWFAIGERATPGYDYTEDGLLAPMRVRGKEVLAFFPWESIIMIQPQLETPPTYTLGMPIMEEAKEILEEVKAPLLLVMGGRDPSEEPRKSTADLRVIDGGKE
ncbi:MAG: hypothetical protein KAR06_11160 [Deltaproteobacteria bacterium]|nr:hypothetical protein [Deltaproteobacteria bacterium]